MKMSSQNTSRRQFLKSTTATAGVLAFPAIIPASALGKDGSIAPSNRITMGAIGTGSMGTGDMRNFMNSTQVLSVCDVDRKNAENAKGYVDEKYKNKDCRIYEDYREMLEREHLDTVCIALPDHWHALPAIDAARAGIDIFGQKPLARSVREGRAICDAVKTYGRVWQTGSWQRSEPQFHKACSLVRNGRIGKVHTVEVGLPAPGSKGNPAIAPVPEELNWDRWLGPAPWTPYRPFSGRESGKCHGAWRALMDYSGGLTDFAAHHIDIAHWGLGFDYDGPLTVEGTGLYRADDLRTTPYRFDITCTYPRDITMRIVDDATIARGVKWIGDKGWIFVSRAKFEAYPKQILNETVGPEEIQLHYDSNHKKNFLDSVKSRELTTCPAEIAQRSITPALLGEIAMLTGRKIRWDAKKEEIIGDPGASALLGRSYREPWSLL